jgi:hypothetical protein
MKNIIYSLYVIAYYSKDTDNTQLSREPFRQYSCE